MPILTCLLPTEELYKSPDFNDFEAQKNQWIENHVTAGYSLMSDLDKWDHLMNGFREQLESAHDKALFERFRDSRKEVTQNQHNISINQCLAYFEWFMFLYGDNESE